MSSATDVIRRLQVGGCPDLGMLGGCKHGLAQGSGDLWGRVYMAGQCHHPNVMLDLGWSDGAVALVLEGFALETLLNTMSQHHWSDQNRP